MTNYKRIICIIMAAALSLSLCACDLVGEEPKPNSTPQQSAEPNIPDVPES